MARQHIDHEDIARFAQERVNLPKDKADDYRAAARRQRQKGSQILNTLYS